MRILLVSHRFPPDDVYGVERYSECLGVELRRRGHAVAVLTRREDSVSPPRLVRERRPDGIEVFRLAVGVVPPPERFLERRRAIETLVARVLTETRPDVVHVNHLMGLTPRLPQLARAFGAAVVLALLDFHVACALAHLQRPDGTACDGPDEGRACARTCFADEGADALPRWLGRTQVYRQALDAADRVLCPSQYVAGFFTREGAVDERFRVLPLGIEPLPALPPEELSDAPRPLRLAFLGKLDVPKGPQVLLEALERARLRRVEVLCFGTTPDYPFASSLRRRAARIPGVRFRIGGPFARHEDLSLLLTGVDAVVLPSLLPESFSLVTREALSLGLPVIVARRGGMAEAVREGVDGFTFDPGRPAELAAILARLDAEPALRQHLADGARAHRPTTIAEHAGDLEPLYEEAVDRVRERPGDPAAADAWIELLETLGFGDGPGRREASPRDRSGREGRAIASPGSGVDAQEDRA